ncbi:hypothetical protein D9757_009442 [Collybiopsis confluens]|uniref:CAP-Gly domain-containing protein n=1 Tax=Collybiopsis confluens TaxID=2823264 RepID=A0A8H5M593_9AGAR|nr:hypothetical protein D9757_009442 [Collybiopsis confluens]
MLAKSTRTPGRASGIGGGSALPTPRSRSASVVNSERAKTPSSSIPAVPSVPAAAKFARPSSRTSGGFVPTLNESVRIESLGFEGVLRYLGEIPPKLGIWAGVELSAGFAGKGKNDGSTPDGNRYFQCAPMCGVFVSASKLSRATAGISRPPSVASNTGSESMSSLLSASSSASGTGRITPAVRTGRLSLAASTSSNTSTSSYAYRSTSTSGRITPSNSLSTSTTSVGPETPAARAGRLRAMNAGTTPLAKTRSQGANAEKPVPVPAIPSIPRSSSAAGSSFSIPSSLPSPTMSNGSPRRIPSSNQTIHLSSPFTTPKVRSLATPSSGIGLGSPQGATPRPRVPSAIAMPPPPSPSKNSSAKELSDLERASKDIQDRIRSLTGEVAHESPPSPSSASTKHPSPPSATSTSFPYSSHGIPSPTRRPQSRIASASAATTASRARSRSRAGSVSTASVSNSISSASVRSTSSRPPSVASTTSVMSSSARGFGPRSSTPGFGPRSSTPGFGPRTSTPGFGRSISRAGAETPTATADERLERMQSRVTALEYENARLRDEKDEVANPEEVAELIRKVNELELALSMSSQSDSAPSSASPSVDEATTAPQSPSRSLSPEKETLVAAEQQRMRQEINNLTLRLDDASEKALSAHARAEQLQSTLEALQSTSDSQTANISQLEGELAESRGALSGRETELAETKGLYASSRSDLEERQVEVDVLKKQISDVEKRYQDERERDRDMWDVERRELRNQVDELRKAGQETIALYEEKLDEMRIELSSPSGAIGNGSNRLSSSVSSLSRSRSSTLAEEETKETASAIDHSALMEQLSYLQSKVSSLSDALEDARALHQSDLTLLQNQLTQSKMQFKSTKGEFEERARGLEMEIAKREKEVEAERRRRGEVEEALRECGEALEEARAEVEGMRLGLGGEEGNAKKENVEELTSELASAQASLKSAKSEIVSYKEEIAGLKHLMKELQRIQRDSARDEEGELSENVVLRKENEVLRKENEKMKREFVVNGPLMNGFGAESHNGEGLYELQKEIESLRKKLGEEEAKAARKTHVLHKEISELEALVEAKIYREDELEQEVERLNEKLRKASSKRSGKSSFGPLAGDISVTLSSAANTPSKHHPSVSNGSSGPTSIVHITNPNGAASPTSAVADGSEPVCEICEKPGHDIFSCDLLREDYEHSQPNGNGHAVSDVGAGSEEELDVWCEECEGHGHRADQCPYAEDVF